MQTEKAKSSHCDRTRGFKNQIFPTIVAREMVQEKPKESRANIQVHIRDVNDNPPEFQTDSIEVFVAENVGPGSTLAWIRAEDKDSGILGKYFFVATN